MPVQGILCHTLFCLYRVFFVALCSACTGCSLSHSVPPVQGVLCHNCAACGNTCCSSSYTVLRAIIHRGLHVTPNLAQGLDSLPFTLCEHGRQTLPQTRNGEHGVRSRHVSSDSIRWQAAAGSYSTARISPHLLTGRLQLDAGVVQQIAGVVTQAGHAVARDRRCYS